MDGAEPLHGIGKQRLFCYTDRLKHPKKLTELSIEQIRTSAKMLDEMIAIYNRYFIEAHKYAVYDPRDGSEKRNIAVKQLSEIHSSHRDGSVQI